MNAIDSAPASGAVYQGDTNVSTIVKRFEDSNPHCRPGQQSCRALDLGTQEYEGKRYAETLQSHTECSGSVPTIPARPVLGKGGARASNASQNNRTSEGCRDESPTTSYVQRVQELESQLVSAREDVGRISAQHRECDEEIQRLRGEVASSRRAKLDVVENALESITEMNDHIARLKSQIERAELKEIELRDDLAASRTRERNLIRQIEELGETVIEVSKELQKDCEFQISRRRQFRNSESYEHLDNGPSRTDAIGRGTTAEVGRQSEQDSDSTNGDSVFDATAASTNTDLTTNADNEQDQNCVDSTASKDQSCYQNSTKTSRLKINARGPRDRLALRRNNDWTSISV